MEIRATIILLLVFFICSYLIHQYAHKGVKFHIKAMTLFSWMFCFLAYILLPVDIYYVGAFDQTTHEPRDHDRLTIETMWLFLYWGNFCFSWLILPFFMAYEASGGFDVATRCKRALLDNLLYYAYFGLFLLPILSVCYFLGMLEK